MRGRIQKLKAQELSWVLYSHFRINSYKTDVIQLSKNLQRHIWNCKHDEKDARSNEKGRSSSNKGLIGKFAKERSRDHEKGQHNSNVTAPRKVLIHLLLQLDRPGRFTYTAEPAYNWLQGNKDFCQLDKKSVTRGVEYQMNMDKRS